MNISFVLDTFGGGGKERRCLMLIQGLIRQGFNNIQVVIINDKIEYTDLYETNADVRIIDRKGRNLSFFSTMNAMRIAFADFKPDIVQTWGGISTLIPVLLRPFFRYKLIGAYVADADSPKLLSLETAYPLFCNKVVGNSIIGLDAYRVPVKKRVLIHNGFNEMRFNKTISQKDKKYELGIDTQYVVAMLAAFWENKDWACYLNTAKKIIRERNDISFLAIGAGVTWEEHNRMITDEERFCIKMLGRRDDVDEILQICDLTVLTSNHGEGVSNSIMESMAWGVPVVATNSGGTPEIIEDGINGILLQKNDVDILSYEILNLIENVDKRKRMGENAAKTVKDGFLLEEMTQKYIELYQSL